jgi:MHS family alpha-ketoglutarate permease-like MFS transporter
MTQTQTAPPRTQRPVRRLLAASVGNAVEWYGWYACTSLATYVADQAFPKRAEQLAACWSG